MLSTKTITKFLLISFFTSVLPLFAAEVQNNIDFIVSQAGMEQERMEKGVKDMNYLAKSSFVQKNNEGKTEKRVDSKRMVYQKNTDKIYMKYVSMSFDNKELSQDELNKEIAKQKKRKDGKMEAKSPFSPLMRSSYTFSLAGETKFANQDAWIVGFKAKEKADKFIDGKAYISKKNYNVLYMDFTPSKLPGVIKSIKMSMEFSPVQGYWLPYKFKMEMYLKVKFILTIADKHMEMEDNYSDYKINTNLPDSLFKEN